MHCIVVVMVLYPYYEYMLHMTKIERLNGEIQKKGVITSKELFELASKILEIEEMNYRYLYTEYLRKLLQRGMVVRPRRGIYVAVDPSADSIGKNHRYIIASKIRSEYYLGFHTALELHGCAYSWFKKVTICLPRGKQFRPFEFRDSRYVSVSTSHPDKGIESISRRGHQLFISNPSRTFLDCLDRPRLAGGWEEVLKSLSSLPGVKGEELLSILRSFDCKVCYRKVGYVLDILKDNPYYEGIPEEINDLLLEQTRGAPVYIDRNHPGDYNEKWNIYLIPNMNRMLEGI